MSPIRPFKPLVQQTTPGPDGVVIVDKPRGLTSHDVVTRVRRILRTRRIGHVGTLDPLATGVLPLVVGRATRLASLLSLGDKIYHAVFRLGISTDTYDVTGRIVSPETLKNKNPPLTHEIVEAVKRNFVGTFKQVPPPYSAKKIGGVRAYQLARRRESFVPKAVEVKVKQFQIEQLTTDHIVCRVTCAPGFYIRSLANDLGQALGCGACLENLRREQSGPFTISEAASIDQLEQTNGHSSQYLIPMARLLPNLQSVVATERGARLATHGNTITSAQFKIIPEQTPTTPLLSRVKIYDTSGNLLAIAERTAAGVLHPRVVLA